MQVHYKNGQLRISADLYGSAELIWIIITDTTLWSAWGPSVVDVQSENRFIGAESRGKVKTTIGIWLPFSISDYREMQYWSWKVAGLEATGHEVEKLDKDHTRLSFTMPWWSAPYLLVCGLALRRIKNLALTMNDFSDNTS